jgi:hypothetical protein
LPRPAPPRWNTGRLDAQCFRALIEAKRLPHGDTEEAARAQNGAVDQAALRVRGNTEQLWRSAMPPWRNWTRGGAHRSRNGGDVTASRALHQGRPRYPGRQSRGRRLSRAGVPAGMAGSQRTALNLLFQQRAAATSFRQPGFA